MLPWGHIPTFCKKYYGKWDYLTLESEAKSHLNFFFPYIPFPCGESTTHPILQTDPLPPSPPVKQANRQPHS